MRFTNHWIWNRSMKSPSSVILADILLPNRYQTFQVVAMTPDGQRVILTRETVVIAPPEYSPPGYSPPGYSSQPTITQPPPPAITRPAITRQPRTQRVVQDIGQDPVHVICPNCQNVITTTVSQEASQQAATACLCMFLCGYAEFPF